MTKHTAGLLGSLTEETLRAATTVWLQRKLDTLEAGIDADGYTSTADEADMLLLNKELERRDNEPEPPAGSAARGWYLATCRLNRKPLPSDDWRGHDSVLVLVQAKDGAEVEDTLRRHQLDTGDVSWEPLDGLRYGVLVGELRVIPWEGGR